MMSNKAFHTKKEAFWRYISPLLENTDCRSLQVLLSGKGKKVYDKMADTILRNNLCLFSEDGFGSCAYIYPFSINSVKGRYYDPWANDQDWALIYSLKFLDDEKAVYPCNREIVKD